MVMVFVRKMANFVYLPQHGIQPTCSFTAATTQIMATERTQKKNNFIQLIQHQTSWSLFLFHVSQSFYWIQHLGEISSNMVLPFLLWTTEQVLWTLKSIVNDQMAKKRMVGLFEENPWFLIFLFLPWFVCGNPKLYPCGKWEWITSIQALMAYLPQGLNKSLE